MEKRIDYLRHQPAATAEELIARDRSIYDMKKELINQEKAAVESEAAMVLEYGLIR